MFLAPKDPYYVDLDVHKFKAEYAKSGRMKCKGCGQDIDKDTVRIAIIERVTCNLFCANDYKWHHEHCFFKKVKIAITPEHIRDFSKLKEKDQKRIKNIIDTITSIVSKKRRNKDHTKPVKKVKVETNKEDKKPIVEQNELFHKYRKDLSVLSKQDIEKLLEANSQKLPQNTGPNEKLESLAECMAFGKLEPCEECKQGQLVLLTNKYKCTGNLTASKTCTYETEKPKRSPMIIPAEFAKSPVFENFTPKTDVRLFGPVPEVAVKPEAM